MFNIQTLILGDLNTNCYIVSDSVTKRAFIIDPGDSPEYIGENIISASLTPVAIIATHGHYDHVLGAFGLQVFFPNLQFYIERADTFLLQRMQKTAKHFKKSREVDPAPVHSCPIETFEPDSVGLMSITILPLPGHTPGSIGVYLPSANALFTGDLLFKDGSTGSINHAYSNKKLLDESIKKVMSFPKDTMLYVGHGENIRLGDLRLLGV